jgi:hypothetical protein
MAGLAMLAVTGIAWAHRSPGTSTTVTWNARAAMLEITHRLHVHDAETGVERAVATADHLSVARREDQARIALYVEERFAIEMDGAAVPIRTLGAELAGDYLLVYQESDVRLAGKTIRVRNDILRDAFADPVNEVFMRDGERAHTLRFSGADRWLSMIDR